MHSLSVYPLFPPYCLLLLLHKVVFKIVYAVIQRQNSWFTYVKTILITKMNPVKIKSKENVKHRGQIVVEQWCVLTTCLLACVHLLPDCYPPATHRQLVTFMEGILRCKSVFFFFTILGTLKFRQDNYLVRLWKTSWFGLKSQGCFTYCKYMLAS